MINHPTSGNIRSLCSDIWCSFVVSHQKRDDVQYLLSSWYFPIPVRCNKHRCGCNAWTLGLRDILATTMCFNYRINAFERQVTQYFVWEDAWCCCSNGYLLHSFMCLSKLLHSAAFSLAFGSWKYHPTKLVFWSFMAPFGVRSVCVLGGGQQTLRHGNHWVDVMG